MQHSKHGRARSVALVTAGFLLLVGCQGESVQATEASESQTKAQQNGAATTRVNDGHECSTSFHCEVGRYCSDEGRCVDDGARIDPPK